MVAVVVVVVVVVIMMMTLMTTTMMTFCIDAQDVDFACSGFVPQMEMFLFSLKTLWMSNLFLSDSSKVPETARVY